jgi:uncharacterized protein
MEDVPLRVADDSSETAPIEIPVDELSPEGLRGLVESVVLREGTDYGERERSFEGKIEELLARLRRGEARIVYDFASQSADIVPSGKP